MRAAGCTAYRLGSGALGQAAGSWPYGHDAGTNRSEFLRSVTGMSGVSLRNLQLARDWLVGLPPSFVWSLGRAATKLAAQPGDQQTRLSTRLERYLA